MQPFESSKVADGCQMFIRGRNSTSDSVFLPERGIEVRQTGVVEVRGDYGTNNHGVVKRKNTEPFPVLIGTEIGLVAPPG